MDKYNLIFVDCEGHGPAPTLNDGDKFEFGAVEYNSKLTFHGVGTTMETFTSFRDWLEQFGERLIFVSDNPAYDWQFVNYYFHKLLGTNPFGHSARRISDFYAGITGNFYNSTSWKRWRVAKHDHNPVNDAMGNVEAFAKILEMIKGSHKVKSNDSFEESLSRIAQMNKNIKIDKAEYRSLVVDGQKNEV